MYMPPIYGCQGQSRPPAEARHGVQWSGVAGQPESGGRSASPPLGRFPRRARSTASVSSRGSGGMRLSRPAEGGGAVTPRTVHAPGSRASGLRPRSVGPQERPWGATTGTRALAGRRSPGTRGGERRHETGRPSSSCPGRGTAPCHHAGPRRRCRLRPQRFRSCCRVLEVGMPETSARRGSSEAYATPRRRWEELPVF